MIHRPVGLSGRPETDGPGALKSLIWNGFSNLVRFGSRPVHRRFMPFVTNN